MCQHVNELNPKQDYLLGVPSAGYRDTIFLVWWSLRAKLYSCT